MKFDDAKWQLDGAQEAGLYPVETLRRPWCLDAKRPKPVLKITRKQIPLVPAFAITAHSSQGKTLAAAILDLAIDKRTDATLGTVAASRVRSRHDVLILRAFPLWLFQRGAPEGLTLLLQTLRGHPVDWSAYQEARRPVATCQQCSQRRAVEEFPDAQWERVRANLPATCQPCLNEGGKRGPLKRKYSCGPAKFECVGCKFRKTEDAFPRAQLVQKDAAVKQRCLDCVKKATQLTCAVCHNVKDVADFASNMVTLPQASICCKSCQAEVKKKSTRQRKGWFSCRNCKELLLQAAQAPGHAQCCSNCASRSKRKNDEHTCRRCKRKFHHEQIQGAPRVRFCTACHMGPN